MRRMTLTAVAMGTTLIGGGLAMAEKGYEPTLENLCRAGYYGADANADGRITRAEAEDAAARAFDAFDADGSGDISAREFEVCANAGKGMEAQPTDRSEANMGDVDRNGDMSISYAEFVDAVGSAYDEVAERYTEAGDGTGEARTEGMTRQERLAGTADAQDAVADRLSNPEDAASETTADAGEDDAQSNAARDMAESGDNTMTESPAMQAEGTDMDDGRPDEGGPVIVLRRFVFVPADRPDMRVPEMSREEISARALMNFHALDRNRDQRLSPEEWNQSEALKRDMAEVLNMRFTQDDADQSGSLSREEFIDATTERVMDVEDEQSQSDDSLDVGGPTVYYHYPHVM